MGSLAERRAKEAEKRRKKAARKAERLRKQRARGHTLIEQRLEEAARRDRSGFLNTVLTQQHRGNIRREGERLANWQMLHD